jgi:pyroglutamyl-peptidase
MPARVLVTGFEPFGPHSVNPSERVLRPLAAARPGGAVLSTRVLRVSYRDAFTPIREALDDERFDAVLLLGLAVSSRVVLFERVAVNRRGGALADNDGVLLSDDRIEDSGPTACFATVPIDELVTATRSKGVPAAGSDDAGTFLCNQVLYQTLRHCVSRGLNVRAGFIHLPPFPEQVANGEPCLPEQAMINGVSAAIDVLAQTI